MENIAKTEHDILVYLYEYFW